MSGTTRKRLLFFFVGVLLFMIAAGLSRFLFRSGGVPNVLLIVVDTLRADHLSCYGWGERTSPNIDRIASEGVLAERMICQAPQTLPSFCTILTGTYPPTHGVRANGRFALSPDAITAAELFREQGYRTGAILAGFPLDSRFGLDQGFESYDDEMTSHRPMAGMKEWDDGSFLWLGNSVENFENTADVVTGKAVRWLGDGDNRPFFLMVHYFDPHHDYAPPERFRGEFAHLYSGEVAFVDEQIGVLLDEIENEGIRRNTLVVITADHGECLGELGRYQHQEYLTEGALHVPFIASWPGVLSEGLRLKGLCRSVDILPTLCGLTGIESPERLEGVSLAGALERGRTGDPSCYSETLFGLLEGNTGRVRRGITSGRWRFIANERRRRGREPEKLGDELYDLETDPIEENNLMSSSPDERAEMKALLERFLREHPEKKAIPLRPDRDAMKKLKALGYF